MHDEPNDTAAIRREIEATRERIADTAEAIAYQTDVPARFKDEVAERVETAKSMAQDFIDTTKPYADEARVTAAEIAEIARQAVEDATRTASANVAAAIEAVQPVIAEANVAVASGSALATRGSAELAARNPLALAIGSFLVGVVVGALLPKRRRHEEDGTASDA